MSDYFSHLVERSMGIAESVQPLIAPLFAPPSYSAFLSLDTMMRQPPDSVAQEEITASPPLSLRIEEILSQPKAEKQSEQPVAQPLQRESVQPTPAASLPLSSREETTDSGNTFTPQASKTEQPHVEGSLHKSAPLPERLSAEQAEHDQATIIPIQPPAQEAIIERNGQRGIVGAGVDEEVGWGPLWSPDHSPSVVAGQDSVSSPDRLLSMITGQESVSPSTHSPSMNAEPQPTQSLLSLNDGASTWARQAQTTTESLIDDQRARVEQARQTPISMEMPMDEVRPRVEQTERVERNEQIRQVEWAEQIERAGHITSFPERLHAPTEKEQPINPLPRKSLSRDSHPLDALVRQQSALYPAPLLPGELSLLASQSSKENRRDTGETADGERASFAAPDERNGSLTRRNSQRPSPAHEVPGDLAPEPGAEQNPPMISTRRDDGVNELAPIIRVSIGRVEVRATIAPAANAIKRAAPAAPAISLSDYLQRRKGGVG